MKQMQPWTVRAVNLPEHAENPIHTDDGARAAGFERALVAGVTTYAYLMHPPCAAWGRDFLDDGWTTVRLRSPVFEDDLLEISPDGDQLTASVDGAARAVARAGLGQLPPELAPTAPPELSEPIRTVVRDLGPGSDWWRYTQRAGDDLALHDEFVAPATWVSLANHVFHRQLVSGSWIHTGSVVRHLAAVPAASTVAIEGEVVDRSAHRLGTMATADLRFHVDDTVVVEIRHTALVELT